MSQRVPQASASRYENRSQTADNTPKLLQKRASLISPSEGNPLGPSQCVSESCRRRARRIPRIERLVYASVPLIGLPDTRRMTSAGGGRRRPRSGGSLRGADSSSGLRGLRSPWNTGWRAVRGSLGSWLERIGYDRTRPAQRAAGATRARRRACGSSDVEPFAGARRRGARWVGGAWQRRGRAVGICQPRARGRGPLAEILTTVVACTRRQT